MTDHTDNNKPPDRIWIEQAKGEGYPRSTSFYAEPVRDGIEYSRVPASASPMVDEDAEFDAWWDEYQRPWLPDGISGYAHARNAWIAARATTTTATPANQFVSEVDRWKYDLITAGWMAESATAWRAPDGSLWRGPAGAWKELQRRVAPAEQPEPIRCVLCAHYGNIIDGRCRELGTVVVQGGEAATFCNCECAFTATPATAERSEQDYEPFTVELSKPTEVKVGSAIGLNCPDDQTRLHKVLAVRDNGDYIEADVELLLKPSTSATPSIATAARDAAEEVVKEFAACVRKDGFQGGAYQAVESLMDEFDGNGDDAAIEALSFYLTPIISNHFPAAAAPVELDLVDREQAAKMAFDTVKAVLESQNQYSPLQVAAMTAANIRYLVPPLSPCVNCNHPDPHNGPAGTVDEACTHEGCNCGYYTPSAQPESRVADMAEPKSETELICVHCGRELERTDIGPPINDITWSHVHNGVVWCNWPIEDESPAAAPEGEQE